MSAASERAPGPRHRRRSSTLRVWWPVWLVGVTYLSLALVLGIEVNR